MSHTTMSASSLSCSFALRLLVEEAEQPIYSVTSSNARNCSSCAHSVASLSDSMFAIVTTFEGDSSKCEIVFLTRINAET